MDDPGHSAQHLILGGGLAGGLIALALADVGRGAGVVLVDQDAALGGNHTWSFHDTDLDSEGHRLVADLVTHRWPRQQVRFPGYERTMQSGYSTISSEQFGLVLAHRLRDAGVRIHLRRRVSGFEADGGVRLDDGTTLAGALVIDARGPASPGSLQAGGYQKFVGLELELASDGPWAVPLLMDATVPQVDGYRFTYVLPFSRRRVLVEDTVYSNNALMDEAAFEKNIRAYLQRSGVVVARVLRREKGVLPLPVRKGGEELDHQQARHAAGNAAPMAVGYEGGFFHAVTGYSLPMAVRVALAVARSRAPEQARNAVAEIGRQRDVQHRFGRLLNRLMFRAMAPQRRWTAFERFYRLPEATISRFYAGRSTWTDQARVLVGRPPAGVSWMHLIGARRREAQ